MNKSPPSTVSNCDSTSDGIANSSVGPKDKSGVLGEEEAPNRDLISEDEPVKVALDDYSKELGALFVHGLLNDEGGVEVEKATSHRAVINNNEGENREKEKESTEPLQQQHIDEKEAHEASNNEGNESESHDDDNDDNDEDSEEEDETLYCICQRPESAGWMIACDLCDEWYHGRCVSLTRAQSKRIDIFVCPPCAEKTGRTTTFKSRGNSSTPTKKSSESIGSSSSVVDSVDTEQKNIEVQGVRSTVSEPTVTPPTIDTTAFHSLIGISSNSPAPLSLSDIYKDTDCGICLLDLYDGQSIHELEICQHVFHLNCLNRCVGSRNCRKQCPKCFTQIGKWELSSINQLVLAEKRRSRANRRYGGRDSGAEEWNQCVEPIVNDTLDTAASSPFSSQSVLTETAPIGTRTNDNSEQFEQELPSSAMIPGQATLCSNDNHDGVFGNASPRTNDHKRKKTNDDTPDDFLLPAKKKPKVSEDSVRTSQPEEPTMYHIDGERDLGVAQHISNEDACSVSKHAEAFSQNDVHGHANVIIQNAQRETEESDMESNDANESRDPKFTTTTTTTEPVTSHSFEFKSRSAEQSVQITKDERNEELFEHQHNGEDRKCVTQKKHDPMEMIHNTNGDNVSSHAHHHSIVTNNDGDDIDEALDLELETSGLTTDSLSQHDTSKSQSFDHVPEPASKSQSLSQSLSQSSSQSSTWSNSSSSNQLPTRHKLKQLRRSSQYDDELSDFNFTNHDDSKTGTSSKREWHRNSKQQNGQQEQQQPSSHNTQFQSSPSLSQSSQTSTHSVVTSEAPHDSQPSSQEDFQFHTQKYNTRQPSTKLASRRDTQEGGYGNYFMEEDEDMEENERRRRRSSTDHNNRNGNDENDDDDDNMFELSQPRTVYTSQRSSFVVPIFPQFYSQS